ncbi:MAG: stage II sporulation protein D [Clostridia bacterium]|nr:stage II sporulation protein D [Clostridia bacterium]
MRAYLILCLILAAAMLICPAAALGGNDAKIGEAAGSNISDIDAQAENGDEFISVMSSSTGEIEKIKLREYVIGSVAAEMDAESHTQALKAQAVACYTYAKRTKEQKEKAISSYFSKADITDDPSAHQGYINEKQRKEKWGESYEKYEEKIEAAVDEVFGIYVAYDGETALTAYHAISSGKTQSAKSMWGSEYPYLSSVASPGDKLSPDYVSEASFGISEFRKLSEKFGAELEGDADGWLEETTKNNDGYTSFVRICGEDIEAEAIRNAFSLRSMCFDVEFKEEKFVFTCKGYGHGVGMSQYGADYMARQGSSWEEILRHYYPGTEIVYLNN